MAKQSMKLMPAAPGTCCMCARDHGEYDPHDFWSLFYQMRFKMKWGRDATHADVVAHLPPENRDVYREALEHFGQEWTEPDGDPVAESYAAT